MPVSSSDKRFYTGLVFGAQTNLKSLFNDECL